MSGQTNNVDLSNRLGRVAAPANHAKPAGAHFSYTSEEIRELFRKGAERLAGYSIKTLPPETPEADQAEPPAIERTALSLNPSINPADYKPPVKQLAPTMLVLATLLKDPAAKALLVKIMRENQAMQGVPANV